MYFAFKKEPNDIKKYIDYTLIDSQKNILEFLIEQKKYKILRRIFLLYCNDFLIFNTFQHTKNL